MAVIQSPATSSSPGYTVVFLTEDSPAMMTMDKAELFALLDAGTLVPASEQLHYSSGK